MEADKVTAIWLQVLAEKVNESADSDIDAINNHTGWYVAHSNLP